MQFTNSYHYNPVDRWKALLQFKLLLSYSKALLQFKRDQIFRLKADDHVDFLYSHACQDEEKGLPYYKVMKIPNGITKSWKIHE